MPWCRKMAFAAGTLVAGCLAWSQAVAQVCDPSAFWAKNVTSYTKDVQVFMSYLNNVTKSKDTGSETSGTIGYAGFELGVDDARSLSEYLNSEERFNLSSSESVTLLRSELATPKLVDAYLECLRREGGTVIYLDSKSKDAADFQVTVAWKPNYVVNGKRKLEIKPTNGSIEGNAKNATFSVDVSPQEEVPINVSRDVNEHFELSAVADGRSDKIVLPPKPKFDLKFRIRSVPSLDEKVAVASSGGKGKSAEPRLKTLCIFAEETVLLPSTFTWVGTTNGDIKRAYACINGDVGKTVCKDEPKNTSFRACGKIRSSTACQECRNSVAGRFHVLEGYTEVGDGQLMVVGLTQGDLKKGEPASLTTIMNANTVAPTIFGEKTIADIEAEAAKIEADQ